VSIVLGFKQADHAPDGESDRMTSLQRISGYRIWRLYGDGDRIRQLET
jgi:hypothetical protein